MASFWSFFFVLSMLLIFFNNFALLYFLFPVKMTSVTLSRGQTMYISAMPSCLRSSATRMFSK